MSRLSYSQSFKGLVSWPQTQRHPSGSDDSPLIAQIPTLSALALSAVSCTIPTVLLCSCLLHHSYRACMQTPYRLAVAYRHLITP